MADLKFTQTAVGEFKIETPKTFCLNGLENDAVLYSNSYEFFILDMMYSCDFLNNLPFHIKQVRVPQEKPLVNLVKDVDYVAIYGTASVLETQQLAIDHIYVTDCSMEPPKPRLLQAEFVSGGNKNSRLCCVLTSYGACDLIVQDPISTQWTPLNTKLNQMIIGEVFPIQISPSDIRSFPELQKFVDTYYITAFAWSLRDILYVGTAGGYVITFRYLENEQEFQLLDKMQTSLGRISYINTVNSILLVGSSHGQVRILKYDHANKSLREMDYLWSKQDRMACCKAIITYSDVLQSYLVVFCKAAHILAYRLDSEGCILSNSTLHTRGIQITGLESLTDNEFIITTIMCTIQHITISYPTAEELHIDVHTAQHDLDAANFQILGVKASKSRNIWSFLLYRNKDYNHRSKHNAASGLLSVCKLNTHDSLIKLSNMNLTLMDNAKDLLIAVNMDVNNNCDLERYNDYVDLNHLQCELEISDEFVQKLQMKFTIIRQISNYQKMKFKCIKRPTEVEKYFLETIVQVFHILQRLQYLQTLVELSTFQELSVICMQTHFLQLFDNNLAKPGDDNPFATVIEHFSKVISDIYDMCKFDIDQFKYTPEICWICQGELNATNFAKCSKGHEIKRCTVSYVQLKMFATQYCPNCYALVTNDDAIDLLELFGPNEVVKCTFCRYLLKDDIF